MVDLITEYEKGQNSNILPVLKNELRKIGFQKINSGNQLDITEAKEFLEEQKKINNKTYAEAVKKLDEYFAGMAANTQDKLAFEELKETYHNDKISELVMNTNSLDGGIFIEKNQLFPSENNVYFLPGNGRQIRAHFYAPKKLIFNQYYDTYWVNIGVIMLMTLFLIVFLYFDILAIFLKFTKRMNRKLGRFSFNKRRALK
jgi:hypothetical protein